jgi:Leucine-rich repeat (LRR) protein
MTTETHTVGVNLIKLSGETRRERVAPHVSRISWSWRGLVSISAELSLLTRVCDLKLSNNKIVEVPPSVFKMRLVTLHLDDNRLVSLPPDVGQLTLLKQLWLGRNRLKMLPRELKSMQLLETLDASDNSLQCVPAETGALRQLQVLNLQSNRLTWLPVDLQNLREDTRVFLRGNPLALHHAFAQNARGDLESLSEASDDIATIRDRAMTVCVGLHDLELPAFVTLQILDMLFDTKIRMWAKWELITAAKHFHQRRGRVNVNGP